MKRYIVIFLLAALLTGCGSSAVTEDITTAEQTTAEQTESADTDETDAETDVFSGGIKDREVYYSSKRTNYEPIKLILSSEDAAKIIDILKDDIKELNTQIEAKKAEHADDPDYAEETGLDCDINFKVGDLEINIYEEDMVLHKAGYNFAASKKITGEQSHSVYKTVEDSIGDTVLPNGKYNFRLTGIDDNTLHYYPLDDYDNEKTVVISDEEAAEIVEMINSAPKEQGITESIDNIWFYNGGVYISMETETSGAVANIRTEQPMFAELTEENRNRINEIVYNKK